MQTALITGGSKGFGLALATSLVKDGWGVVIDGRDRAVLDVAVSTLLAESNGGVVRGIAGDVADRAHRAALVDAVTEFGGLDLLVNNASTLGPSPLPRLAEYPLDDLKRVLAVNLVAPLALIQATLPLLRASHGTVIDITSDAAVEGYNGWGGYGSSKAALEQLSNVLAAEETDVRVYWFDPGDMRTEMHQAAFPGEDISDRPLPETVVPAFRRLLATAPPSGRFRASELQEATP
ncbi:MAG TPA: SDR family oxidoreductase [Ilumatobacteraceae bacterium]|jgi:NAD(P)-dependent dehydrogenase (short-subunit alcohol dehydrogenase family)|nr:SDR family oxidoreductase [Ilumatobacteraceae bacterium]